MAQDINRMIEKLNDLIALDRDAVDAYESAIKNLDTQSIASQLRAFQGDHQRHIRELSDCVVRFGGKAREKPDVKGFFIKGFTEIRSRIGDEQALKAMRTNEQLTNRVYKDALDEAWPDDVRQLIQTNYGDEQRHLSAIEQALRDRPWETQRPGAQP